MSINVTSASYSQASGKVEVKGTRSADVTVVTVTVPGGGGDAELQDGLTWKYTETLAPPRPAEPISIEVTAQVPGGTRGATFNDAGLTNTNIVNNMSSGG